MVRFLLGLLASIGLAYSLEEWDAYYYGIRQCLEDEFRHAHAVRKDEKLNNYLRSVVGRLGYYAVAHVMELPSHEVCYLVYLAKRNFGMGVYVSGGQLVVLGVYSKLEDAKRMIDLVRGRFPEVKFEVVEVK